MGFQVSLLTFPMHNTWKMRKHSVFQLNDLRIPARAHTQNLFLPPHTHPPLSKELSRDFRKQRHGKYAQVG